MKVFLYKILLLTIGGLVWFLPAVLAKEIYGADGFVVIWLGLGGFVAFVVMAFLEEGD